MRALVVVVGVTALLTVGVSSCGTGRGDSTATERGSCPTQPVTVVVSVDQWGDIVRSLGGDCAKVTTIVSGTSADPHDYEPTPADSAAFANARLVVVNGLGYDTWALKATKALDEQPTVVDGGKVVGRTEGDNPHIWYDPAAVQKVGDAVTGALRVLSPGASAYLDERSRRWSTAKQPYLDAISAIARLTSAAPAGAATYAATESVFDDMARAVGLTDLTPRGYRSTVANGAEPSPGDIAAFNDVLGGGKVDVLVDNTQTQGAGPAAIRKEATASDVGVVEVTETMPPDAKGFIQWQVDQLTALHAVLEEALRR